jgi:putative Mn2+ efflux pump MntP
MIRGGNEMDKKRHTGDVVLLGIGLSLLALGIYMKIVMSGKIIYGPVLSMQILMWTVTVCGLILAIMGGIRLYKGRSK